ncbi:MAG: penicillin-binding transpeptidase domain-containing protein [Acidiferrobacterales bacterium]|nr:penicillin-binding transpeptidase domain-containing protein [Acidiferrobacterales bacterium]
MATLFVGVLLYPPESAETGSIKLTSIWNLDTHHVANSITPFVRENEYPEVVQLRSDQFMVEASVEYHLDPQFKQHIDDILTHYKPDFAAVVAIDPETGKILALNSFVRDGEPVGNLTVHSGFPAASLFKIVTATAVLDQNISTPDTLYQFNGKDTSLYKKNVLRHKKNKWTRTVTLTSAFGRSINTVFGRMGVFEVGGDALIDYSRTFGFDHMLPLDLVIDKSQVKIDPSDEWQVAEAASGYTNSITMSPLHAAMMVATIVNDGVAVEPRLIKSAHYPDGPPLYTSEKNSKQILDVSTAQDMRVLMRDTVAKGSARKRFRGFFKGEYADLDVGGKTGSLTGNNPQGRTEWFVGYADSGTKQIAVAAVVVNKDKWRIKPSALTRKVFEEYFKKSNASG